ncbi:MAG TPA: NAD-dependent epimerase/dehydratase family protein [Anaerolineales bacterium]|nr:NAD-dependent epimerase/dehydratase family protein [Anaerolineales bacterium]
METIPAERLNIELIKEGVVMAKILVTGGAGFIGSHVVDLFLAKGYEVVILDDLSTGRRSNLNPGAKFYQIDIRSPEVREVFAAERPDYVSHHAAQMDVRRSVAQPLFDADVNILGSINLIECAREFEVKRFVYISTGGAAYGEPERLPCDEEHPVNPICQYGASKHTVEHYLYMYYVNYGLKYTVLRYPNVFGPRQNPHGEAGVVAIFTGKMLAGESVIVNGDGEQTRDFVYVGDCAYANYLAVTMDHQPGIYNLGWGRPTSINEIFFALANATGYSQPIQHGPAKVGETRHIYLDARKAAKELGWTATVTLEQGLEKTVAYLRHSEQVQ